MGSKTSKPQPRAPTAGGSSTIVRHAVVCKQGNHSSKKTNEDAWCFAPVGSSAVAAVFDGHRGDGASQFCADSLPTVLTEVMAESSATHVIAQHLEETFVRLDVRFIRSNPGSIAGCSALAVAVACDGGRRQLIVAGAGDCRAVLCQEGGQASALFMEHTPDMPAEAERVLRAGGELRGNGRVYQATSVTMNPENWGLQMTRSIGDADFKFCGDELWQRPRPTLPAEYMADPRRANTVLSGVPTVQTRELEVTDEFVVLGSDGLWDGYMLDDDGVTELDLGAEGGQAVISFVGQRLARARGAERLGEAGEGTEADHEELRAIADELISRVRAHATGAYDDCTVAILLL